MPFPEISYGYKKNSEDSLARFNCHLIIYLFQKEISCDYAMNLSSIDVLELLLLLLLLLVQGWYRLVQAGTDGYEIQKQSFWADVVKITVSVISL